MNQQTFNFIRAARNKLSGYVAVLKSKKVNIEVIRQIIDRKDQLDSYTFELKNCKVTEDRANRMKEYAQDYLSMYGLK